MRFSLWLTCPQQPAGSFDKLHEDGMDVLRDAKAAPEFRDAEQEARERRVAQLVC